MHRTSSASALAVPHRGVLLKKRALPMAPWSRRSFQLSGQHLVYSYPDSTLERHYQVTPAWRIEAGRGDVLHLRVVDRHGRQCLLLSDC